MTFVDMTFVVQATNTDPELSVTRQCLLDVKDKAEVLIRYRRNYDELTTNLSAEFKDQRIVLPKDLRYTFLQLIHADNKRSR